MLFKNIASQKLAVYAYDTDADAPETGDAANITCEVSIDGGTSAAVGDTNPTELDATDHPGIYIFDLTQAETNGDMLIFSPVSSTANIHIEPVIVYTGGGVFSDGSGTRVGSAGAATGFVRGQDTDSLDDVADAVWTDTTRTLTAGTNLNDISASDVTDAIEALTTADGDTWAELATYVGAFVLNNITASGVRDRGNTKDRITASRTATTRTVTARDAT